MHQSTPITALALALVCGVLALPLAGCNGPHPFVRDGDSNGVEVFYSGAVADALPVATKHCAQYERVPHYIDAALGIASFRCARK
jgi:hypothetical protein